MKNNFGTFSKLEPFKIPVKKIQPIPTNKKNFLDSVKVKKHEPDTSLNIFEWIKGKFFIIKNEEEKRIMETIKNFIVGFIFRWVLKIGGGFFLAVGLSEGKVEELIGAIVSIVIGLVISLFQHDKAIKTEAK